MVDQKLLVEFLRVYAFQPATAFWRAVEVAVFQKYSPDSGVCLDLGCGDGKLTSILLRNSLKKIQLVGIDGDPDETLQASHSGIYGRVHTCLASQIPEPDSSFDGVISNSVLEHIEDLDETIAEASRLLKNGGRFVFTVPSPDFHRSLYGPLFRRSLRDIYLQEMDKRLMHYRYLTLEEWRQLLARHALAIESSEEYFNLQEVRRWETISRFTAGILYELGRRKQTPMTVQKKLGLRSVQNKVQLPRFIALVIAAILSIGLRPQHEAKQNACYLVVAKKRDAKDW